MTDKTGPLEAGSGAGRLAFPAAIADWLIQSETPVIITGGGGWLGQATLEMLDGTLGATMAQRVFIFGSNDRTLGLRSGRRVTCQRLDALAHLACSRPLMLHYAFLTREKVRDYGDAAFIRLNTAIADQVAAAVERLRPVGLFIPSSGAVYRPDRSLDDDVVRNPYGALKVRDEERFTGLCRDLDVALAVLRVFNLSGPFINKIPSYALGSIITDVLCDRPIVIRADMPILRSFIHVGDLIAVAIASLITPSVSSIQLLDGCGREAIEIGDLGRRVATVLGRSDLPIQRPIPLASDRQDRYLGDATALTTLAATLAIPLRDLTRQICDTADYLREGRL